MRSSVVIPAPQLYVYGLTPPLTVMFIAPLLPPLQDTFVFVFAIAKALGCVTVNAI